MISYYQYFPIQSKQTLQIETPRIKFKKDTECILQKPKDKQIEEQTSKLKDISKENDRVQKQLENKRQRYFQLEKQYSDQYKQLCAQKQKMLRKLFLIKTRKRRILAEKNSEIREEELLIIRKYLKGFVDFSKAKIIQSMGGINEFKRASRTVFNLYLKYKIRPEIRAQVYRKICLYWNHNDPAQKIMLTIKKYSNSRYFFLEATTITGKYEYLNRLLSENEMQYLFDSSERNQMNYTENPLKKLLILWEKAKIYLLRQYFEIETHRKNVEICYRKYCLKLYLQKQRRKMISFQKMMINNIFESRYNTKGFENLELNVLVMVKDRQKTLDDLLHNIKRLKQNLANSQKMQSIEIQQKNNEKIDQLNYYQKTCNQLLGQPQQESQNGQNQNQVPINKSKYIIECLTIKSYPEEWMFSIRQVNILEGISFDQSDSGYIHVPLQHFFEYFQQNFMIQLKPPKLPLKALKKKQQMYMMFRKNHQDYNDFLDDQNPQENGNPARIVKVINFEVKENLSKIIRIQSFIKMKIKRKFYESNLRHNSQFKFAYRLYMNILLSANVRNNKIIFFIECLFLSSENNRQPKKCLEYPEKYWNLARSLLFDRGKNIIQHCLVWQIEQYVENIFNKQIAEYEIEQKKIMAMKPEKFLLRLRKFFTFVVLRKNRIKNIVYIKKIKKSFGVLALMIRKSPLIKNIYQVQLYSLLNKDRSHKQRYQTIYLKSEEVKHYLKYSHNFKKIENEFFITEDFFIIKPLQNKGNTFIQRFSSVLLSSPEIQNQLIHVYRILKENPNLKKYLKVHLQGQLEGHNQSSLNITEAIRMTLGISEYHNTENSEIKKQQRINSALTIIRQMEGEVHPSNQLLNLSGEKSYQKLKFEEFNEERIYYCIYKDSSNQIMSRIFQLVLFKLQRKKGYDQFTEVYRKQLKKKEINEASLTLIYRYICQWVLLGKMACNIGDMASNNISDIQQESRIRQNRMRKSKKTIIMKYKPSSIAQKM